MNSATRFLALCTSGLALGLLGNAVHPAGVPLRQPVLALADVVACAAPVHDTPVTTLAPAAAQQLRASGVVFGDLRPANAYAEGHIAGAVHLPCRGALGQETLRRVPPGSQLLLYDWDGTSAELAPAAATARQRGLQSVHTLQGGFQAWLGAGLPAESGTCETCAH